ncbi:MAG: carboxypeptidase-like regulatory domain-containing protein [Planctomycetaceae bacterium]
MNGPGPELSHSNQPVKRSIVSRLFIKETSTGTHFRWSVILLLVACFFLGIAIFPHAEDLLMLITRGRLTDEERIQLLDRELNDISNIIPRPAYEPTTIKGRLEWEGDIPNESDYHLEIHTQLRFGSSGYYGGKFKFSDKREFETDPQRGLIWVSIRSDLFKDNVIGPFGYSENNLHENVVIKLEPGVTSTIRVVDENLEPAVGVEVSGGGKPPSLNWASYTHEAITDENGEAIFKNMNPDYVYSLTLEGPGYQQVYYNQIPVGAFADEPLIIKRSIPATGKLIDSAGNPVKDAVFTRVSWKEPNMTHNGWDLESAVTTGEDGIFKLEQLKENCQYDYCVSAPDQRQPESLVFRPAIRSLSV